MQITRNHVSCRPDPFRMMRPKCYCVSLRKQVKLVISQPNHDLRRAFRVELDIKETKISMQLHQNVK